MDKIDKAKILLRHYITMSMRTVDGDCYAEIDEIIDSIVEGIEERAERELKERIADAINKHVGNYHASEA